MGDIKTRLQDPTTRAAAISEISEWVRGACLLMGSHPITAYKVAAAFCEGLTQSWSDRL